MMFLFLFILGNSYQQQQHRIFMTNKNFQYVLLEHWRIQKSSIGWVGQTFWASYCLDRQVLANSVDPYIRLDIFSGSNMETKFIITR